MIIQTDRIITLHIFLVISFLLGYFPIDSQLLNNIIRLADDPYRYSRFSFNSEGDMVIDTGAFPKKNIRKFFGVKKNGREFFTDSNENKTYYSSMELEYSNGGLESESIFVRAYSSNNIKFNGKEFIFGVSKSGSGTYKTEFHDLIKNYTHYFSTYDLFGELITNVFSIIPDPLNTNTTSNYFISYIASPKSNEYKLLTKKINFNLNSNSDIEYNIIDVFDFDATGQKMISCFLLIIIFIFAFSQKKIRS